ncbi:MAG: hypothetical protein H6623_06405 [Bdellovibrionaceae bacterium]|nr:hypothetical protein [Pseudobdellovibrionaceae bacterium]
MDLDNFEFKPLTTGLGFDKKAEDVRPQRKDSAKDVNTEHMPTMTLSEVINKQPKKNETLLPELDLFERSLGKEAPQEASRTIKEMLNALPPSLDFVDNQTPTPINRNYNPVGRVEYAIPKNLAEPTRETPAIDLKETSMDISLDNTLEKAFPKVGFRKPFFHQTVEIKPQFTPITASFTSAVIDALVISGLTALFLVSLIVLTKVDLIAVILHTQAPLSVWLEIGLIFLGVYMVYYMYTRGSWGSTLGDWAFDIQLGMDEDRLKWYYPAFVIWRMMIIAMTGFVVLPLASFIAKKDLAGKISGVSLYTKNY